VCLPVTASTKSGTGGGGGRAEVLVDSAAISWRSRISFSAPLLGWGCERVGVHQLNVAFGVCGVFRRFAEALVELQNKNKKKSRSRGSRQPHSLKSEWPAVHDALNAFRVSARICTRLVTCKKQHTRIHLNTRSALPVCAGSCWAPIQIEAAWPIIASSRPPLAIARRRRTTQQTGSRRRDAAAAVRALACPGPRDRLYVDAGGSRPCFAAPPAR
jgi:hypothetical protein